MKIRECYQRSGLLNSLSTAPHTTSYHRHIQPTNTRARVASFKQENTVLSQLIGVPQDQDEYPSIVDMENKLINCDTTGREIQHLADCASRLFLGESGGSSYIPGGPGDSAGRAASDGELILRKPLA